jgi:hypothetical protein
MRFDVLVLRIKMAQTATSRSVLCLPTSGHIWRRQKQRSRTRQSSLGVMVEMLCYLGNDVDFEQELTIIRKMMSS